MLMQELWKLKLSWDDEIPLSLAEKWVEFYTDLYNIKELKIPRHAVFSDYILIEMHGFCDSSIKAYGACIYIRCLTAFKQYVSNLLCAKSRVAPLKQVNLPRLELCGAVLLANLAKRVKEVLNINFDRFYYWTDSTITLYWIKNEPNRWKTFVANRVSEIRSLTDFQDWNHVKSEHNPADLISRGVSTKVLSESKLWWHGPNWFKIENSDWELLKINVNSSEIPEQKTVSCVMVKHNTIISYLLTKFSSFNKIVRILAYVLRFIANLKCKTKLNSNLTLDELEKALNMIIRDAQIECFSQEYNALLNNKDLAKNSKILGLNPFLQEGILRVGGKIKKSNQVFDKKHPIILPQGHVVTNHILKNEHKRLLHCGVQNLLYSVRHKYWPILGRNLCKKKD